MRGDYIHKGNLLTYTVLGECKIKDEVTREWVPGILYHKNGDTFVRTIKDFEENFIKVESGE